MTSFSWINYSQYFLNMGTISSDSEIDEKAVGYPYSDNKYWKMVKAGHTGQILKEFQNGNLDCYQVIEESSKHTIVHESIILDRKELFKMCQVYGADWQQADANGVTPLMKAAGLNRQFYVDKLLQLGVKVVATDLQGRTAADYARLYENHELADRLEDVSKDTN